MIQHRVFIANSNNIDIAITDPIVQNILKSGDRAAYINNDIMYYAIDPNQNQWYSIGGSSEASTTPTQYITSDTIINDKNENVELYKITTEVKTDEKGNKWQAFDIADQALLHIDTRVSHLDNTQTADYLKNNYTPEGTSADEDAEYDFTNILSMILQSKITSVNHNIKEVPRILTSTELDRSYNENNLVSYGVHLDQMYSVKLSDESQIDENTDPSDFIKDKDFTSLTAGIYRFPIAKIFHSESTSITKDARKVNVCAFKPGASYKCQLFVTADDDSIINNTYNNCSSNDISVNLVHKDNCTIIYIDVDIKSDYTQNLWVCNAICTGFEHTRFANALDSQFHSVVGTSYDCFGTDMDIYKYTADKASEYSNQERYNVNQIYSKGYPYLLKVTLIKDPNFNYIPSFENSSSKEIEVTLDDIDLLDVSVLSEDKYNLYYETGTSKPAGVFNINYSDIYNDRQYTANKYIIVDDLESSVETINNKTYNVINISVTPTRGKASLSNEFNIAFIAFCGDRSINTTSVNWQQMGYDLDSALSNPPSSTLTYNSPYFSLLGTPSGKGASNGILDTNTDINNTIASTYCSGDCRAYAGNSLFCFPYISVPEKLQYTNIISIIKTKLALSSMPSSLDELNTKVMEITKNKVKFTQEEFDSFQYVTDIYTEVSKKLLEGWNGLIPSNELYYFNMSCKYFDKETYGEKYLTSYTFTGGQSAIPQYIVNYGRNIYNVIFYLKSNKSWKDIINYDDIQTSEHDMYINGKPDATHYEYISTCPSKFSYNSKSYKLATMTEINRRVIKEQSFVWDLTDIDESEFKYQDAIFSYLYKIEPDENQTYSDDDVFLKNYDANNMSKGRWLFINPILQDCRNAVYTSPVNFIEASDNTVKYDNKTHVFTFLNDDGSVNCYKYALPCNIISQSTDLTDDQVKEATEDGLPLNMIVEIQVSGINNLSQNFRNFLQSNIKNYVINYLDAHPEEEITNIPGITSASSTSKYILTLDISDTADADLKAFSNKIREIATGAGSSTSTNNITFYYNSSDLTDESNFKATVANLGQTVLYGRYTYDNTIDDWTFNFIDEN